MYRRTCQLLALFLLWTLSQSGMAQVLEVRCGAAGWQALPDSGVLVNQGQPCWLRVGPSQPGLATPDYLVLQHSPMLRLSLENHSGPAPLELGWRVLLPLAGVAQQASVLRLESHNPAFAERLIPRGSGSLAAMLQVHQRDLMTTLLAATLLLTSAVFTGAFGVAVKESQFLAYGAYALALGLSLLSYRQFDLLLLNTDLGWLWQLATPASTGLLCWLAARFGNFHRHCPGVRRALYLVLALNTVLLLWSLLALTGLPLPALPFSRFQFENYQDMVVESLIMLGGWLVWRSGAPQRQDGLLLMIGLIPSLFIDLVNQVWDPLLPWLARNWDYVPSASLNAALHFNGALTWLTLPAIFCLALARRAWRLHSALVAERNQLEVRVAQRTCELSSANKELEFQASTDALTGVLNRRRMMEQIGHEIERSRRYGLQLSLCMLDIDHFKRINDSYGHLTGDRALVAVAEVLASSLRDADQIARFGGEEFLLLLPETSAQEALTLVERLRHAVAALPLFADRGEHFGVTISGGIAAYAPETDLEHPSGMLTRADHALYEAKTSGRNCVRLAHPAA